MENILAQAKPKSIKLADGKDYNIPPMDMTTLANVEKTLGFSLSKLATKMESEAMGTLRLIIYALLKEAYPEMTIEQAGRLVTLNEIKTLSETISSIMAVSA